MAADSYQTAKSMKEKPEKKSLSGVVLERWWEVPEEDTASRVMDTATTLEGDSGNRMEALVRFARLYENCDISDFSAGGFHNSIVQQIMSGTGQVTYNIAAMCVDTLLAKVTKNRPIPTFLTDGGSWTKQIQARSLEKWTRGYIYETKVHQKLRLVLQDSFVFDTGFLQVFPNEKNKLECERVMPGEIFVDPLDGQYGAPRQMARKKLVSRDVLTRLYPKKAQEIADAGKREKTDSPNASAEVLDNTIEVWEMWHLPSGAGAPDGLHVICIDKCTLYREEWKICKFPFVPTRFKTRVTGYHGKGVVESVQGIQIELNRTTRSISEQFRRKGKGRTYLPLGSKVVTEHMTNASGGDFVYYAGGVPPHTDNNNAIAAEEFAYVDRLFQKGLQVVGISELSASAKKPSGLDAAVALREMNDIESERFAPQFQDYERVLEDFIDLSIDLITEQYGWSGYKVLVPGRRDLLEVDWAKIDLKRDAYVMKMWPISSLPQTPGARLQRVEELRQGGYIPNIAVANRLLDFPDLEAEQNLANAMIDDVDATISYILDDEVPELKPLESYQNLDLLITRGTQQYLYARHRGCPENRLSLLRQLINSAAAKKVELTATPPPAPPMGPPGMPPPPGAGGPPGMQGGSPQANVTNNLNVPIQPAVPPVVA